MLLSSIFRFLLRLSQITFAAVCLGITAYFLNQERIHDNIDYPTGRLIYTLIIAIASILTSLLLFFPLHFLFFWEFLLAAAWFIAFGVLVGYIKDNNCGSAFDWGGITGGSVCDKWRATQAFAFLSACVWLISSVFSFVGLFHHRRAKRDGTYQRRGFFGRSKV